MLYDENFLIQLDQYPHHHTWAKIVALNKDEYPIEEISGKVINGSINIDGTSSTRRTCSLSLVAEDVNINEYYWGLKTKFEVYVGLENYIDKKYPDIIWFKQGVFAITSFSCSLSVNQYTISIQGKDKSVFINGEMGGVIPASWSWDVEDTTMTDEAGDFYIEQTKIPIKDIILEMVHEFTQEPWQNIVVNDLDDYGIEMLEYRGSTPLYYFVPANKNREIQDMDIRANRECWIRQDTLGEDGHSRVIGTSWVKTTIGAIEENSYEGQQYYFEKFIDTLNINNDLTISKSYFPAVVTLVDPSTIAEEDMDENTFNIAEIQNTNGLQVCGYRLCDIVYPYDLVSSVGETVTSVLDKLVKMLGNFEYFYDVDGRFIFQKKKTFTDVSYNNIMNEHSAKPEVWADSVKYSSKYSYTFDYSNLNSSIQNSPNFSNIKNDFSIWGQRYSGSLGIPIHMRYAIDKKLIAYKTYGERDEQGNIIEEGQWFVNKDSYELNASLLERVGGEGFNEKKWLSFLGEIRKDYPFINSSELARNWWKLEDWGTVYKVAFGDIPTDTNMSYDYHTDDPHTVLDNRNFASWEDTINLFNCYCDFRDLEGNVSIIDIATKDTPEKPGQYEIVYIGHGYNTCSHSYQELLDKKESWGTSYISSRFIEKYGLENIQTWVYDPRFWELEQIKDSSSIINQDFVNRIKKLFAGAHKVDWRELIFQMANDYRKHYHEDDFLINIKDNNTIYYSADENDLTFEQAMEKGNVVERCFYPTGYTGYEQYYVDFEMNMSQSVVAPWRELYNWKVAASGKETTGRYNSDGSFSLDSDVEKYTYKEQGYSKGDIIYTVEINGEKEINGDKNTTVIKYGDDENDKSNKIIWKSLENNNKAYPYTDSPVASWVKVQSNYSYNADGWNSDFIDNPEVLNFWFDFLDSYESDMEDYSVHNIGLRSKATNDDKIKSIYFREIPNVIFTTSDEKESSVKRNLELVEYVKTGYTYIHIPARLNTLFTISSRGKSCMDVLDEYLYNYTYMNTSITLNTIPIYYLTPNTLIYVNDPTTGIVGEYIMTRYSIQLGLQSSMSITANETIKRIY